MQFIPKKTRNAGLFVLAAFPASRISAAALAEALRGFYNGDWEYTQS
jgi:hypothetical protein